MPQISRDQTWSRGVGIDGLLAVLSEQVCSRLFGVFCEIVGWAVPTTGGQGEDQASDLFLHPPIWYETFYMNRCL